MRVVQGNRNRLTIIFAAFVASGCASTPNQRPHQARTSQPPSVGASTGESATAHEELLEAPISSPSDLIQPVGYDDKIVVATQLVLEPTDDLAVTETPIASSSDQIAHAHATATVTTPIGGAKSADYFIALAMDRHPSIQAARQRVAAAINRVPQARALPDPMFNNTFWPIHDQSLQTASGRIGNQMSLSQAIPWPEKLRTKANVANQEVQIAQADVDRIEREITESVRLAYYEVWFATRAMMIIKETKEVVDTLNRVAESRYRTGGSQQDVLRARLEADRLEEQLINLTKQQQVAQADLAALVQQPVDLVPEADDNLGLADVPARLDQLIARAEECNPELIGLASEVRRDRQKQRLACLQQYPDLQFGVQWGLVSDDGNVVSPVANGHDTISFNVGTTLPIWRNKINAGIREAAHQTSSTTERLDAERNALYGKLRRLLAQADALIEQRDVYEKRIIPRVEDTLNLSIADWRGSRSENRTDFFTVIETYRELLMFETQLARINASLAGTLAQIERAAGCPGDEP